MAVTTISIRTDSTVKAESEKLFEALGMNMTTAINIFLRQAIREKAIPFDIREINYSTRLLEAAEEAKKISHDSSVKSYSDVKEMFVDLDA